MDILTQFQLRAERQIKLMRALRKSLELTRRVDRTKAIGETDILAFTTLRNELVRLPFFLKYYRDLGISHFLMVDNGSDDGSAEYLADQPDVSLWTTVGSYKRSKFGVDWLNHLQWRYGAGHWNLVVDVDEFLVYPFCDTRPLQALTDCLDTSAIKSFGAMLLDMYPKGPVAAQPYQSGQNPIDIASWFDSGNYVLSRDATYQNLWIQGGVRARKFFAEDPAKAPALNKTPLVRWTRKYAYVSSTHRVLPRGLNKVYDDDGGEKVSGVLLHAKFLDTLVAKSTEELTRRQHYGGSREYQAYSAGLEASPDLWCDWSTQYINWRQLEILGLMSKGHWA
ncbi:glycosyltransferase family 2 protein [Roseicitreum antarcticum]|uniref:Glycosyl transferase family 2 n=1 Tax=Roseicitreum antarcticum TaxID=564137 RepID=A0A1H2X6X2_9RHOB|nr:glycosyltransferase family 2 protein [Roseicitreum antarcticum]SDW88516.1 Glycosyl transferase family 2 [Roseicitreum antarcticum]